MKIVCISDTHGLHKEVSLPDGDILIHAGDISKRGRREEIEDFNSWLGDIREQFKEIVVIAGNHDFLFETKPEEARALLTNAIYLENESTTIEGVKIWGSPVTPWFFEWAFNRQRGEEISAYWNKIPEDVNIVITHGPCQGISDTVSDGQCVGCSDLMDRVEELKELKLFVCGHIHEGYGMTNKGEITFVNASVCNVKYQVVNQPLVVDMMQL